MSGERPQALMADPHRPREGGADRAVVEVAVGILIRADRQAIDAEALMHTLIDKRLPAPGGGPLIDLLLDTLQRR